VLPFLLGVMGDVAGCGNQGGNAVVFPVWWCATAVLLCALVFLLQMSFHNLILDSFLQLAWRLHILKITQFQKKRMSNIVSREC
jgi:hypothetical protein